jgi:hypothetical protein
MGQEVAMKKDFDLLVEVLSQLEGVEVIETSEPEAWIHFRCPSQDVLAQINDLPDKCRILVLGEPDQPTYQLFVDDALAVLKKLTSLKDAGGDLQKARLVEMGIPDLSLVTIHQITTELKQRGNLCFALVWMEDKDRDNIAIEGSAVNPTFLVGLITRGLHMAIEWADKNIKFSRPKDE